MPFELVYPSVLELDPGTDDQILHRARHEELPRPGYPGHAGADVHSKSADVVARQLYLAGMQAGSQTASTLLNPLGGKTTSIGPSPST